MNSRHLTSIAAPAAVCLIGAAIIGLPWADAHSDARAAAAGGKKVCVRYDADDTPACIPDRPGGHRGPRGRTGRRGAGGAAGPVGLTGPLGKVGPTGPAGPQGGTGVKGVHGPPGAFSSGGSDPGGHTVVVLGSKIGPIPFPSGPGTGTELTPSVARCPTAGPDQEAYDGGATVVTNNPNASGPTGDVVGLEDSYAGLYVGSTEVDPLPAGATPGAVSQQAANAYEVQAVVTNMHSGDNVTVQAYVVCGP